MPMNVNSINGDRIATNTLVADRILSGSITSTQIGANQVTADKINVSSLSAVSANVGLLRTAGTGARTEIYSNVIKVFSANNGLAVQIGDLNA